ncbi:MAG: hypothetical protein RL748_716, partial [Pseudomonadota bacterium]
MEMFVQDHVVAQLEAGLAQHSDLNQLLALAWHLRQRDTRRALACVGQISQLLRHAKLPRWQRLQITARMRLVQAEAHWLMAQPLAAEQKVSRALQHFTTLQDAAGLADGFWLRGWLASDQGNALLRGRFWEQALQAAHKLDDRLRILFIQADHARSDAFAHHPSALARWQAPLSAALQEADPAAAAAIHFFLGVAKSQSGNPGDGVTHYSHAYEFALKTGQRGTVILALANAADNFNRLNDYQSALDWCQRALDVARPTGWPRITGSCLLQCGNSLRLLGQLEAGHDMLRQTLVLLTPLPQSRSMALALHSMADLALDQGDFLAAQAYFEQLRQVASVLKQPEFTVGAKRGLAQTLLQLGRAEAALDMAQQALHYAEKQQLPEKQIEVLAVLADIHTRYILPAQAPLTGASPALYYLSQAQQLASQINGYTLPVKMLDALAQAFAESGQLAAAFKASQEAITARDKSHSGATTNRAIAMQVRIQTERAQAESE